MIPGEMALAGCSIALSMMFICDAIRELAAAIRDKK